MIWLRIALGATMLVGPSMDCCPHWVTLLLFCVLLASLSAGVAYLWRHPE